jgi:hypothetical protein
MAKQNRDSEDIRLLGKNYCWLCGRTQYEKPRNWYAPWWLQIAHIASGGGSAMRVDDIRAVTLLCPQCHDCHVSDSDRLPSKTINGEELPTIDARHTIWLKEQLDPEHYDRAYLASIWIGIPPDPEEPPRHYQESFAIRTGIYLHS